VGYPEKGENHFITDYLRTEVSGDFLKIQPGNLGQVVRVGLLKYG
jgi:hypothetical protein